MPQVRTITLPQLLGTIPTVIFAALLLITLALFAMGYIKKKKGGSWRTSSWLLRNASAWTLIYGVLIFAFAQADAYLRIGVGVGSAEIWQSVNAEAYGRLCAASAVALFAWTLNIILGKPNE